MPTVIPINLSLLASQVLRIISLYPPVPVFPNSFNNAGYPVFETPSQYVRDTSITSFGYPHSPDSPFTLVDVPGVFSVPANAYSFVLPSFVNGKPPNPITDTYSVILLDVDVALIEPGFSRLRVDYLDVNGNSITDYLDMPFYPKWDTHPREEEEIRQYAEEAIAFMQREIYIDEEDILQVLNRMQTKGFHVSGQIFATESTNTAPFANPQSHNFQPNEALNQKFAALKFEKNAQRDVIQSKTFDAYSIVTYPSNVYVKENFQVVVSQNINKGDTLAINGYPLTCTYTGNTFTTSLPLAANFNYSFNLSVINKGIPQTLPVVLEVKALPSIDSVTYENNLDFATYASLVTVNGQNFGNSGSISFNGIDVPVLSFANKNVTFQVPNNINSGFLTLTNQDGKTVDFQLSVAPSNYNDTFVISPVTNTISFGQTINYQALYNGNDVSVNWSLEDSTGNLGNGNLAIGFIDNNGNYTAPNNSTQSFNISIVGNYINQANQ